MLKVSSGKVWSIGLCISTATAALFALLLTVPAQADHCRKLLHRYTDIITSAMDAGKKHFPHSCQDWKAAIEAATALKELSTHKDCYHGKLSGMASNVERFRKQEREGKESMEQICEAEGCMNESGDAAIAACTRAINVGLWTKDNEVFAISELYNYRGLAWRHKGDNDRAIADYTEAIRVDPTHALPYKNRCWARAALGRDLQQALTDCTESLRLKPSDADAMDSRGFVYLRLNRLDDAIADYDAALNLDPKKAYSLYGRGVAELQKGNTTARNTDIAAAKSRQANVAEEFAKYGIKPDIMIATPAPSKPAPLPAADCARAETHWKSAEEIRTLAVYEDHLARFPNCEFAGLAKARIESLKK